MEFQGSTLLLPSDVGRGRNPAGGKSFYVSNLGADDQSDDYEGTDPQYPLATIGAALAKVTTRKHDYIFVQDSYDQEAAFPLLIAYRDVHLIGLGNGNVRQNRVMLDGGGEAAISIGDACDGAEIAGFSLGCTGAAASAILCVSKAWKVHVHHCNLGEDIAALHGIESVGLANFDKGLIDNCYFGRYLAGAGLSGDFNSSFVAHNWFRYFGTIGMNIGTGQSPDTLSNRFFKAQGAAEGWAITIAAGNLGLALFDDNRAMEDGAAPASEPFSDLTGGGTPNQLNAWGVNYKGKDAVYPA